MKIKRILLKKRKGISLWLRLTGKDSDLFKTQRDPIQPMFSQIYQAR
jgi:hypothetical protein